MMRCLILLLLLVAVVSAKSELLFKCSYDAHPGEGFRRVNTTVYGEPEAKDSDVEWTVLVSRARARFLRPNVFEVQRSFFKGRAQEMADAFLIRNNAGSHLRISKLPSEKGKCTHDLREKKWQYEGELNLQRREGDPLLGVEVDHGMELNISGDLLQHRLKCSYVSDVLIQMLKYNHVQP